MSEQLEWVFTALDPLGEAACRLYGLALGDTNPLVRDGVIAPPTLIFDTFQIYSGHLGEDGQFEDRPGQRRTLELRAGNTYEFGRPARPTDILTVRGRVLGTRQVETRSGRITIKDVEIVITNQDGEWLGTNHESLYWPSQDASVDV